MHGTYTMKQACIQKPDVLFATPHTPLHNDLINILICIVNYIHNGHWMNMFMRVQRTKVPRAASNGGTSAVKTVGGWYMVMDLSRTPSLLCGRFGSRSRGRGVPLSPTLGLGVTALVVTTTLAAAMASLRPNLA